VFKFLFLAFSLCLSQASANPLQLKDPVVGSFVEYKVGKSKYRRQVLSKMESEKLWFNHYSAIMKTSRYERMLQT